MPVIDGVKFACNSCIKGHRSTKCTHKDSRQMVRVKQPGRPMASCCHTDRSNCGCTGPRVLKVGILKKRKCKSCHTGPPRELMAAGQPEIQNGSERTHHRHQSYSADGLEKMVENGNVHIAIQPAPPTNGSTTYCSDEPNIETHGEESAGSESCCHRSPQSMTSTHENVSAKQSPPQPPTSFVAPPQYRYASGPPPPFGVIRMNQAFSANDTIGVYSKDANLPSPLPLAAAVPQIVPTTGSIIYYQPGPQYMYNSPSVTTLMNPSASQDSIYNSQGTAGGYPGTQSMSAEAYYPQMQAPYPSFPPNAQVSYIPVAMAAPGLPNGYDKPPYGSVVEHQDGYLGKPTRHNSSQLPPMSHHRRTSSQVQAMVEPKPGHITPQESGLIVSTNIYSMPSNYGSYEHPLRYDEWRLSAMSTTPSQPNQYISHDPILHGPLHSSAVPGDLQRPEILAEPARAIPAPKSAGATFHNCTCGDACECLGCAAHPFNATSQKHAKEAYMYANEPLEPAAFFSNALSNVEPTGYLSHEMSNDSSSSASPDAIPNSDAVLHPENYLWVEYNVGNGCVGDEASCPCGDECACIACAIHNVGVNGSGSNTSMEAAESGASAVASGEQTQATEEAFDDFVHIDRLDLAKEFKELSKSGNDTPRPAKKSCCT